MTDLVIDGSKITKEQIIDFVDWMRGNEIETGEDETIENAHQAYGIIAEKQAIAKSKTKSCDTDISTILKLISAEPVEFISPVTSLYNSAIEAAVLYLTIAKDAKHIIDDMFDRAKTPLEQYAETLAESEFEETEEE